MRFLQGNTLVTLGGSLAFGVAAIFLARGWINSAVMTEYSASRSEAPVIVKTKDTVSVLVADIDLNFGDALNSQNLRLVDMSIDLVPEGTFSSYDELFTGPQQRLVVLTPMVLNEPILASKISGPGARPSLSALIGENMRAVTIRVNDVAGVGGFVLPGDHVDVIFTRAFETGQDDPEVVTQTFLQNVRVLGVDQRAGQTSSTVDVANTVTLEVSLEDAQRLTLAADIGRMSLTLRKAADLAIEPTITVNNDSLDAAGVASYKPARAVSSPNRYKAYTSSAKTASKVTANASPVSGTANVRVYRSGQSTQHSVLRETSARPSPDGMSSDELAGGSATDATSPTSINAKG